MSAACGSLGIECAGEALQLDPRRAVYWAAQRTLLIADVHLGKATTFARAGLAVPGGIGADDLRRLGDLVADHGAERLVVLGDLVHAVPVGAPAWLASLSAWLDRHRSLDVAVVAGNHDRPATRRRLDARVTWLDGPIAQGPFVFAHEPAAHADGYVFGGHLHPTLRLRGGADGFRSPVFWLRRDYAVLPAFGRFTGGANVRPAAGDRLFVVGPGVVMPVPAPGS